MKKERVRGRWARLAAGAVCVLVCVLACACSGCDSLVQGCDVLQEWYCPQLTVSGSDAAPVPVITHSPSAEENSALLAEFYAPVAQLVTTANEGRDIFSLEHKLTERDGSYYLSSAILCAPGGSVTLPEIYIPYFGEAVMPEYSIPDILTDPELTAAWLELTANGLLVATEDSAGLLSYAELTEMYVNYYLDVSGLDIDLSRFADTVDYDTTLRQAMVLGLCEYPGVYGNEHAMDYDLLDLSAGLLSAVYSDVCGIGSAGFTEAQLLECVRLFLELDAHSDEEWESSRSLLVRLCDERLAQCAADATLLTRGEAARVFIEIYEMMYGKVTLGTHARSWLEDTEDESCIKASWLGIMGDFPSVFLFAPDYTPGIYQLPEFASSFVNACRSQSLSLSDGDYTSTEVSRRDALVALSAIDIAMRTAGVCSEAPTVVVNDRDYEWYYTQHGTGKYSSLNCMPTIAMMATKWYDEATTVTIEEMRGRYLPEYTGGWFSWQVVECLEENGVPNNTAELTEDKLAYLDDGCIILTQMTEAADDASGHCFVIYGYWKRGDTIKYYVHDSDVYDGIDDYGRRPGYAMTLDGRYCDWIIDRIAIYYIVAGDGAQGTEQ